MTMTIMGIMYEPLTEEHDQEKAITVSVSSVTKTKQSQWSGSNDVVTAGVSSDTGHHLISCGRCRTVDVHCLWVSKGELR